MKKLIVIAVSAALLPACAYNSTMGVNDRFQVASTASLFAPSVTTVVDTQHPEATPPTYGGPSITGQMMQAAGQVAGGYLLGQGIGKSGTRVTQNGGGAQANSNSRSTATQKQAQDQGQIQGQVSGGHHNDGVEINN